MFDTSTRQPRIYVACLASYNSGILHGQWIDATSDRDEMQEAIDAILRASPCPNVYVTHPETGEEVPSAEEWAIHDYDSFPNLGEYPGLDAVADMAEMIETAEDDHGISFDDFQAIADNWHGRADDIRSALENFAGIFDTLRDYADDMAEEMMDAEGLAENSTARRYFDYDSYARDIGIEYTVIDCPSGVAVFYPH
jgi:antirestriction protein